MGRPRLHALAPFALAALLFAGCKETTLDERPCPPEGTKLTYESFGQKFMSDNCQTCHGMPSKDRQGAPSAYDFGSRDDVLRFRERIFLRAAADNTTMPPGPDDPSKQDREKLAEWLSCGAP